MFVPNKEIPLLFTGEAHHPSLVWQALPSLVLLPTSFLLSLLLLLLCSLYVDDFS